MSDRLAGLFFGSAGGSGQLQGAYCTQWNATTFENVVKAGFTTYENLAVVNPAAMSVGDVLIIRTPGQPIILGRLVKGTVEIPAP